MAHRILLTGASGYLGGTLLARWKSADLPPYEQLYALVRTDEQAQAVKRYGAEPLTFSLRDEAAIQEAIVGKKIDIVFFLVDAFYSDAQVLLIKALAELKKSTGMDVHFLHTSGAKIFSSHAGAPTDRALYDDDPDLYEVQKSQKPPVPVIKPAIDTNNTVIEQAEALGVRSYIFVPCIVYGRGEGFGNPISIQTVAIVRAAQTVGRVYSVDSGRPSWPVCHVLDNTSLYLALLRHILLGKRPDCGKNGYYLASSGSVVWEDLYAGVAAALSKRGVIADAKVEQATDEALKGMGAALDCPKELVPLQLGGQCTFTARHGEKIGWRAEYPASHILEAADEETALILENTKK
ncbi:hypothetical protein LTR10_016706 [Elasticomyces elasticus]|uniref:NAD-dependent epimerase/dehydratase domain-containing protein n=1 Tax=Exophiala sideris TaxID=1016849 RepID=A0ABR0JRB0_9EURO|nr:hypothetical protein LTR10_016706 [Elasticomyces elasticus]KAK5039856.1 hypothetical protein LTS07_000351 [Exophiala sideris]KAK5041408.1 hypothetical protein LTR13_002883 [Exophiala sideris]KAK5068235.1 hypothetical protein LTR69_000353 [Exophiala sideris]KAK5187536.1 hypothetical protein LTR44_000352 [Eurotiomycetes sp. CCFEE 6388]